MNTLTLFERLRPDNQHLDPETSERIWRQITADAKPIASVPDSSWAGSDDDLTEMRTVGARRHPAHRRYALVGAAAAVMVGAAGLVAVNRSPTQPSGATPSPDATVQPTAAPSPATGAPAGTNGTLVGMVLPALPDGLMFDGAGVIAPRTEPSTFQVRVYGALDDPADPSRMIRLEYADSRSAIPCHSFLSLEMSNGPFKYSAAQWIDAATPIDGATPFNLADTTGSYCTSPSGLLEAGWFTDSIGVDLSVGSHVEPDELVEFAQSLKVTALTAPLQSQGRPVVDLVPDPLPAGLTVLVGEDVPFTQHVTETGWSAGSVDSEGYLIVQTWQGVDEKGLYAKYAPIEAERVTIRGHDGYRFVSTRPGETRPVEIRIWWTEAPGLVVDVHSTELFDTAELTTIIDQMVLVDAAGFAKFTTP